MDSVAQLVIFPEVVIFSSICFLRNRVSLILLIFAQNIVNFLDLVESVPIKIFFLIICLEDF